MKTIYLIGSLRNENIPDLAAKIRPLGYDVFDDWHSAGPEADDCFQAYRLKRGMNYREALGSYAAKHIFAFDKYHLDRADIVVLCLPAGKSGHLELGYAVGCGKKTIICFDKEPERFDQMYQFVDYVALNEGELIDKLREWNSAVVKTSNEQLAMWKGHVIRVAG